MSDSVGSAPRRHNRANWVGLRTLRQVPKVVGETAGGDPIFEVKSVRLVLRDDATHFSRITTCSKCGRDVPGPPVLSPADLDHPPQPVICKDCVRAAVASTPKPKPRAVPPPLPAPSNGSAPVAVPIPAPDDRRTSALEQRIAQLTELVARQRQELEANAARGADETAAELAGLAVAGQEIRRGQEELGRTVDGLVSRLDRSAGDGRLDALENGVAQLTELVAGQRHELDEAADRRAQQAQAELAELARAGEQLAERHAELDRSLAGVVARLDEPPDVDLTALEALEQRLGEVVDRVRADLAAERSAVREDVEARVRALHVLVEAETGRAHAEVGMLDAGHTELRQTQEDVSRRLDAVGERVAEMAPAGERLQAVESRLEALRASIDADRARTRSDAQQLEQVTVEVRRVERQANERFERLAERAARAAQSDDGRIGELERRVEEAVARLGDLVESQRARAEDGLRDGLAEVRAAVAAAATAAAGRIAAIEERTEQTAAEMSALGELQAALDGGLGDLRRDILAARAGTEELAHSYDDLARFQDDLDDRVEALAERPAAAPKFVAPERRLGRKSAEVGGQLAAMAAAVQELVREHQQFKSQLATLERSAADAAATSSTSQVAALVRVRVELRALREEMARQGETVETLAKEVDALRRVKISPAKAAPARAPVAKAPAKRAPAKRAPRMPTT